MDTSRIQEIILKVNGNDAEKTINRIKNVIEITAKSITSARRASRARGLGNRGTYRRR